MIPVLLKKNNGFIAIGVSIWLLSSILPFWISLPIALVTIATYYIYSSHVNKQSSSNTSKYESSDISNSSNLSEINKLNKQIEHYQHERDQNLKKLEQMEKLKQEKENLNRQMERQQHQLEQFCTKVKKLEQQDELHFMEKLKIEEHMDNEKKKCRDRIDDMEKTVDRYMEKNKNLKFELEMEQDVKNQLRTDLQNAQGTLQWLQQQATEEILKKDEEILKRDAEIKRVCQQKNDLEFSLLKAEEKGAHLQSKERELSTVKLELKTITKRLAEKEKKISELESQLQAISNSNESRQIMCNICEDNQRDICIVPCGHTLCNSCATEIMRRNNKCPTCRKFITQTVNIFLS